VEYELGKVETRRGIEGEIPLREYLRAYNTSMQGSYVVSAAPPSLLRDVWLPSFLSCGGVTESLVSATMWLSSGGTESVVHSGE